jgi:acetyl-CoA carboxylase biotin carboxyl carrier protein
VFCVYSHVTRKFLRLRDPQMTMDQDGVTRVLQAFEQEKWDEIHLVTAGVELHLVAGVVTSPTTHTSHVPVLEDADKESSTDLTAAADARLNAPSGDPRSSTSPHEIVAQGEPLDEIVAPSPGIFWRSPSPGAPPFVTVGMHVEAGAVLFIVEIMKLMNTVSAPRSGVVLDLLIGNGEQVERGQVMLRIRTDTP